MNWLDLTLILVIVGLAAVEMVRGFGRGALDALFLYGALCAADAAAPTVGDQLRMGGGAAANRADADALLLVVFGVLALLVSRFVYGLTLMDLGMFDKFLGLCSGLAAGMIVAHAIVSPLAMADPRGKAGAALVASSTVGNEMLDFPTYHSVMDTITGVNSYRAQLPNVEGK